MITACDISPSGSTVILRDYKTATVYTRATEGQDVGEVIKAGNGCRFNITK